jgi:hypothetical protein
LENRRHAQPNLVLAPEEIELGIDAARSAGQQRDEIGASPNPSPIRVTSPRPVSAFASRRAASGRREASQAIVSARAPAGGSSSKKIAGLDGYGLKIVARVPIQVPTTPFNARYMETKRDKMGHLFGAPNPVES